MADEGESGVCDNTEGSVALIALRALLTELLAIELPSPKVGERSWLRLAWFVVVHIGTYTGCGADRCDASQSQEVDLGSILVLIVVICCVEVCVDAAPSCCSFMHGKRRLTAGSS